MREPTDDELWSNDSDRYPHWSSRFPFIQGDGQLLTLFMKHYTLARECDIPVLNARGEFLISRDPDNGIRGDKAGIQVKKESIETISLMQGFGGPWLFPVGQDMVRPGEHFTSMHWAYRIEGLEAASLDSKNKTNPLVLGPLHFGLKQCVVLTLRIPHTSKVALVDLGNRTNNIVVDNT